MAAAAYNPAFAKKVGIPVQVAREFHAADSGGKRKLPQHVTPKGKTK